MEQWVRTPNDSALHGQDSCFMSIGNHKLHSLDFLLLLHSVILLLSLSPFSYFALFFFNIFIFTQYNSTGSMISKLQKISLEVPKDVYCILLVLV